MVDLGPLRPKVDPVLVPKVVLVLDPEMVQVVLLVLYYLASLDPASLLEVSTGFLDHLDPALQDPDRLDNLVDPVPNLLLRPVLLVLYYLDNRHQVDLDQPNLVLLDHRLHNHHRLDNLVE